MVRTIGKIKSEKILVRRRKPVEKVYIRNYPKDYKLYKLTGDFKYIHPNKLKTWIAFAKAAIEMRGRPLEDVIANVIKQMKGKKFKEEEKRKILLSEDEIVKLKIQAINKGVDPKWIDVLCEKRENKIDKSNKENLNKKKWVELLK